MMWMLLFLWNGPEKVIDSYEIPAFLEKPRATFADLDNDGVMDIWIRARHDALWVLDGSEPEKGFRQLPYEGAIGKVQPTKSEGRWVARHWRKGMVLDYDEQQGWLTTTDYADYGNPRPGIRPRQWGSQTLLPTFEGYMLLEENCVAATFPVSPVVKLSSGKMDMTWPLPGLHDLDGDGREDLVAAPIVADQFGEIRIWLALARETGWESRLARLQFPKDQAIVMHQTGDIDGDGDTDLMVLARPSQNMSLFEEMTFFVYLAEDHGNWEAIASQQVKTKQNLWQVGPVEMNREGIKLYYYKGIIKSHFKMDLFRWNEGGYLEPKPKSRRWTMKGGERDFILLDYDFNDDGLKDMVLSDEKGAHIYYRRKGDPLGFDKVPDRTIQQSLDYDADIHINIGSDSSVSFHGGEEMGGSLTGDGRHALIMTPTGMQLWTLFQNMDGTWQVARLPY